MRHFFEPFRLGNKTLPNRIIYAPLAGCSDVPFRRMTAPYRPGLMFTEMVKMIPLVRREHKTLDLLAYEEAMRPIGGQICGSDPKLAGPAAKIIEDLGFDVVDLNCGCPVDKVTKDGSGSGLLKEPQKIGEILANMVAAVDIPVTVKIRIGWDEDRIVAEEVTRIAEEAGARAIFIHGRTREQAYRGPARWDPIRACKDVAKEIYVVGNGDIFTPAAAVKMYETTHCDALLVARGTMGQPWMVEAIRRHLFGEEPFPCGVEEQRRALLEHFHHIVGYFPFEKAVCDLRRVCCWYIKNAYGARSFRHQINQLTSTEEMLELIQSFPFS